MNQLKHAGTATEKAASQEVSRVSHRLPSSAILSRIGSVALLHGQIDNQLRLMVGDLLNLSKEQALDATEFAGSKELRSRVRSLAKRRLGNGRELALLEALLARCGRASQRRNALLHSVWGTDVDSGGIYLRVENHAFRRAPSRTELDKFVHCLRQLLWDAIEARHGADGFLKQALDKAAPKDFDDFRVQDS